MTWKESLSANYTDGMLILHRGKIVYERYFGCLDETGKHGAMSMTKSLTGLLAEILVGEGELDDTALVSSIVPELSDSAFGNATVRQVMDMTTGLAYSEDYSDPNADIWKYSAAASPLPKPARLRRTGRVFRVSADGAARGRTRRCLSLQDDQHGRAGLDHLACDWQGSHRTAVGQDLEPHGCGAGRLHDRRRQGHTLRRRRAERRPARPRAHRSTDAQRGRDQRPTALSLRRSSPASARAAARQAFAKAGYKTLEGGSYRGMWWLFHNEHGAFAARGVHGQTIYVDPTADMVIVRLASFPTAKNAKIDPTSLPAYQAVAEYLLSKRCTLPSHLAQ